MREIALILLTVSPKNWWSRIKIRWYARQNTPEHFAKLLGMFDPDQLSDMHLFTHAHIEMLVSSKDFAGFLSRASDIVSFLERGAMHVAEWSYYREHRTAAEFYSYENSELSTVVLRFKRAKPLLAYLCTQIEMRTFLDSDTLLLSAMESFQADLVEVLDSLYT